MRRSFSQSTDHAGSVAEIELDKAAELGNEMLNQARRVREIDPIYWSERYQAWIVTGHQECMEGFRGTLPLSTERLQTLAVAAIPEEERATRIPYMMKTLPEWVINVDAPVHTRLRKLMVKAFSKKIAEDQREFVRQAIQDAFNAVEGRDEVEFVEEVARRIPGRVILRLMGLPDSLLPKLRGWSIALNSALGGQPTGPEVLDRAEEVLLEMRELFIKEIEDRRANPREDFLSMLVTASEDDDRLTEEEILGVCYIVLIAGHDTTMNSMVLGTAALADHPEARTYIRQHPDRIGDIIMEIMRYIAMSFAQFRSVKEDFEWRGHQLKQGQFVFLSMAGANRDPRVFSNPDTLDFTRQQDQNMTFAPGMHHCIGHLLAKVQLTEFFPALVNRFDPEVMDDQLNFGISVSFRGLEGLRVRLKPAT